MGSEDRQAVRQTILTTQHPPPTTHRPPPSALRPPPTIHHPSPITHDDAWPTGHDLRYSTRLFAQRYSARYLRCADALHRGAITAVSELLSATLVHRLKLTFTDMLGNHSGIPLQSYTRLDEDQWQEKQRRVQSGQDRPKFFHALKW